jgi:hypothetical protein
MRKLSGLVAIVLLGVAPAAAPAPSQLETILAQHLQALEILGVRPPRSLYLEGTLEGLGSHGTFQSWRVPGRERYDETLGIRTLRTLRVGGVEWMQNANGDVREIRGVVARRQVTEDFIDSGEFARRPEADALLGRAKLQDGRDVWRIHVDPPGGEPFDVALDAQTFMVAEKAFVDGDATTTIDYSEYRVRRGALYALVNVESNGERAYDVTSRVTGVQVNEEIEPSIFAPFQPAVVDAPNPVTVPLLSDAEHFFVRAAVGNKSLLFLIDTGSQGLFLDPAAAARLGLTPEGTLEVRGARRIRGRGIAALDRIDIGRASLPTHVVSVVDLSMVTYKGAGVDGVLGYPFFAAADVRFDPDASTMTIGKPGSLPVRGTLLPIDTDRELPEMTARINGNADGQFVIDTGNNNELLIYHSFIQAHPSVVGYGPVRTFAQNRGVGGSSAAVPAVVYRLELGPFNLYNRFADVMLSDTGAFADRNDAGNIGLPTLKNFVFTFDYSNHALYLDKARRFDDGRYRPQYEPP